jgi:hypothetical protein
VNGFQPEGIKPIVKDNHRKSAPHDGFVVELPACSLKKADAKPACATSLGAANGWLPATEKIR